MMSPMMSLSLDPRMRLVQYVYMFAVQLWRNEYAEADMDVISGSVDSFTDVWVMAAE